MKIISSHLASEVSVNQFQKVVSYTCDREKQKINLTITDIPDQTRRLVLIVDDPSVKGTKHTCCIGWNVLEPKDSPFTLNKDTEIKKEDFLEEDNPKDKNPNNDFYEILCGTENKIYNFTVYALDNEPKITTEMLKEDIESLVKGHVLDLVNVQAAHKA